MKKLFLLFVSLIIAVNIFGQNVQSTGGYSPNGGTPGGAAGGSLTGTYPNPTIAASVTLTTPSIIAPLITGTGTTSATYSAKIQNSTGTNKALVVRDNGFIGFGTDSTTEYSTDVYDGDPGTVRFHYNFNNDTNGRMIFKVGNKNTGASAYTTIKIGDNRKANYINLDAVPFACSNYGALKGTAYITSGSGLSNGMSLFYDNGTFAISGNPLTLATGLNAFTVGAYGAACSECIGVGIRAATVDLHVQKSKSTALELQVENLTSAAAAQSILRVKNSSGNSLGMFMTSAGYTTDNGIVADLAELRTSASAGLMVASTASAPINFYVGGYAAANLRLTLTSTGALAIGGATNYGSSGQVLTSAGNTTPTWTTLNTLNTSGTYTPTIAGVTNIDGGGSAPVAYEAHYLKIGTDTYQVWGKFDADITTANLSSEVTITKPVASTFTNTQDAAGNCSGSTGVSLRVSNQITGSYLVRFVWSNQSFTSADTYYYNFTYVIK